MLDFVTLVVQKLIQPLTLNLSHLCFAKAHNVIIDCWNIGYDTTIKVLIKTVDIARRGHRAMLSVNEEEGCRWFWHRSSGRVLISNLTSSQFERWHCRVPRCHFQLLLTTSMFLLTVGSPWPTTLLLSADSITCDEWGRSTSHWRQKHLVHAFVSSHLNVCNGLLAGVNSQLMICCKSSRTLPLLLSRVDKVIGEIKRVQFFLKHGVYQIRRSVKRVGYFETKCWMEGLCLSLTYMDR